MAGGIVLLAKQSGKTSFSSLWQVKNALGTKKVGHTGTLDSFADGLLVLLAGPLTRLVPFITACDKEYLARITFGAQTDTLDPSGTVTRTGPLPDIKALETILPSFSGTIEQVPPDYSAVHVDGRRASDRIRDGERIEIPPRTITVHSLDLISWKGPDGCTGSENTPVQTADIRVVCSKGTYIRSLARDIAAACGSCAHLSFLRRTAVGPFRLEDAAGFNALPEFGLDYGGRDKKGENRENIPPEEILASCMSFTQDLSVQTGLPVLELKKEYYTAFINGTKLKKSMFIGTLQSEQPHAVFSGTDFCGIVQEQGGRPVYGFVYRQH